MMPSRIRRQSGWEQGLMDVEPRAWGARWMVPAVGAALVVAAAFAGLAPTTVKANATVERSVDAPVRERADGASTDQAPSVSDQYLGAAFEVLLGRQPNAGELATWRPAVELGDLSSVTRALSRSDEWSAANVSELYRSALRRDPDAGGRELWLGRIRRGATLEQVAASLYGSGEYYARAGATPERFVDMLYRDLLGRPADPGGTATWVRRLATGHTRGAVVAALYGSTEARSLRVAARYEAVLRRAADPSGQTFWTGQLKRGGDTALAATLASSGEFFQKATGKTPPPRPTRGQATGFQPFARAGRVHLTHPAAVVDVVGFHQSSQASAIRLERSPLAVGSNLLGSRGRGTDRQSAADVVVPPGAEIRSPVTGTVVVAEQYRLYCKYDDERVVVVPDADPSVRVAVLHVTGARVRTGDRVQAGVTPLADSATVLPFRSQIDALAPDAPWPHVHIEVNAGSRAAPAAPSC